MRRCGSRRPPTSPGKECHDHHHDAFTAARRRTRGRRPSMTCSPRSTPGATACRPTSKRMPHPRPPRSIRSSRPAPCPPSPPTASSPAADSSPRPACSRMRTGISPGGWAGRPASVASPRSTIRRTNSSATTRRSSGGGSRPAPAARHLTGPYVDYVCTDDYTVTITTPVTVGGTAARRRRDGRARRPAGARAAAAAARSRRADRGRQRVGARRDRDRRTPRARLDAAAGRPGRGSRASARPGAVRDQRPASPVAAT